MNFGFTEEQELLRKTVRGLLAERAPVQRVREILESSQTHAPELWREMAELGWLGLAFPERYGGGGLGIVELALLLEELGRTLAPVPFLPTAIAAQAIRQVGSEAQKGEWLPRIAAGEAIASLAITEDAGTEEPSELVLAARADSGGWVLRGRKLFVPDAAAADLFVTVARTEGGLGCFLVPSAAAGLRISNLGSMDLLRPLYQLDFDGVRLPGDGILGGRTNACSELSRVLDSGRVMICAEMVGGADRCLEASVEYARQRVQFGKPIGANQAIKHKCADMLYEVESARSITYYAAWAAREKAEEAPLAAAMAKAYASDAYCKVSAENIQIHGGVGFTWEYDCHLYFKRAKSDEAWLGGGQYHRERVAKLLDI